MTGKYLEAKLHLDPWNRAQGKEGKEHKKNVINLK
jgi:hypothetical protein